MNCENCGSDRILEISAKCSDMCTLVFRTSQKNGYVPSDISMGGDDYLELDICLACGKVQGVCNSPDPEFS